MDEAATCPNCGEVISDNPDYFAEIADVTGTHIIMGGRVVGKTQMLIERVKKTWNHHGNSLVIAPKHDMVLQIRDRFRELFRGETLAHDESMYLSNCLSSVNFVSGFGSTTLSRVDLGLYDTVVVDEAAEIPEAVIMELYRSDVETIIFAGTPNPNAGVVERMAAYNPTVTTWHISAETSQIVPDEKVEQQYQYLSSRQYDAEIKAKYWEDDTMYFEPDHRY